MTFHLGFNNLTCFWNSVCWDEVSRQNRRELQSNYFRSHRCWGKHQTPNSKQTFTHLSSLLTTKVVSVFFWKTPTSLIHVANAKRLGFGWLSRPVSPREWKRRAFSRCYEALLMLSDRSLVWKPAAHLSLSVCVALSPREVSVWRMCCGHDGQICMMNLNLFAY